MVWIEMSSKSAAHYGSERIVPVILAHTSVRSCHWFASWQNFNSFVFFRLELSWTVRNLALSFQLSILKCGSVPAITNVRIFKTVPNRSLPSDIRKGNTLPNHVIVQGRPHLAPSATKFHAAQTTIEPVPSQVSPHRTLWHYSSAN